MNETVTVNLWGKEITLAIDYDCDKESDILPIQRQALSDFVANFKTVNDSLDEVKKYCLDRDGVDIPEKNIPDIFKYVTPESIFIKTLRDKIFGIALMCEYTFDEECGIAVVFKDGKFFEVGSQDIIL